MNCKKVAVISFTDEEVAELKRIVEREDFKAAISSLKKIEKRLSDFLEPH